MNRLDRARNAHPDVANRAGTPLNLPRVSGLFRRLAKRGRK